MSNKIDPRVVAESILTPIATLIQDTAGVLEGAIIGALQKAREEGRQQGLREAIEVAKAQQLLPYGSVTRAQLGMQERIIDFIGIWARGELPGQQETEL